MTQWPAGMAVRPLTRPGLTPDSERKWAPFRASWSDTLRLLGYELGRLNAEHIVLEIDVQEQDLRLDGMPRASARVATPAVGVSFESTYGPLRYATDICRDWQDNIRAIALSLEALRKVDRYGVTKRGEQYTGWKALPATPSGRDPALILRDHADDETIDLTDVRKVYRAALKNVHPDVNGGRRLAYDEVEAARRQLEKAGRW